METETEVTMARIVADFDTGNMLAELEVGYEYPAALGSVGTIAVAGLYSFTESTGIVEHDDGNKSFFFVGPTTGVESAVYDPVDNVLALSIEGKLYRINIKSGESFELNDLASDGDYVKRG